MNLEKIENFIKNSSGVSIAFSGRDSDYLKDGAERILKDLEGVLVDFADVMVIDPEGMEIGINEVRDIRNFLTYAPDRLGRRYVFIYDADRTNQQAANALLKILEEPPRHAVIILTTTRWHLLLPTIRSRVVKFVLNPPPLEENVNPWVDKIAENVWKIRKELRDSLEILGFVKSSPPEDLVRELSGETLKSYLSAFDILERVALSDEREFLSLVDLVISNYSGKQLFKINALLSRVALWLLEADGKIPDTESMYFFDSVARARLPNFNNHLTTYNIAIRYREARRRDEAWNSQQTYTV